MQVPGRACAMIWAKDLMEKSHIIAVAMIADRPQVYSPQWPDPSPNDDGL
jgi:hypothetical protein